MATAPDSEPESQAGRAEPKSALQGAGGRLNLEEPEDAAELCVELQIEPSEAESHAPPCFTPRGVWCSQLRHMVTRLGLSRPAIMRASPSLAASNAGAGEGEACATDVAKYASGRGILSPTSFTSLPIECQDLKEFLQTEDTHGGTKVAREGVRVGGREEGEEGRNQIE